MRQLLIFALLLIPACGHDVPEANDAYVAPAPEPTAPMQLVAPVPLLSGLPPLTTPGVSIVVCPPRHPKARGHGDGLTKHGRICGDQP